MFDLSTRRLKDLALAPLVRLFVSVHPHVLTIIGLLAGAACAASAALGYPLAALLLWSINRLLDGLDGSVARARGMSSDFGGYLDIIVDFSVYSLIPVGQCVNYSINAPHSLDDIVSLWVIQSLLQGVYFVNAAGLFMLSALYEKKAHGSIKLEKELTSATMPPALIEGTETLIAYTLFLAMPQHLHVLYSVFGVGVTITVLQRLYDAYQTLDELVFTASIKAQK